MEAIGLPFSSATNFLILVNGVGMVLASSEQRYRAVRLGRILLIQRRRAAVPHTASNCFVDLRYAIYWHEIGHGIRNDGFCWP